MPAICASEIGSSSSHQLKTTVSTGPSVPIRAAVVEPIWRMAAATDWQDYAEQMWDVLDATTGLVNRAGPRGQVPRPDWRPQTHFETRGQKLGHGVWDLVYDRGQ